VIIKNGLVLAMTGAGEEKKDIAIADGKIVAISEALQASEGEEVLDAGGRLVMPGFVEPHSVMGLANQVFRFDKADANEEADPVAPQLRALDAIDLEDEGFTMARAGGITSVVAGPGTSNLMGGTCCALKTGGPGFSTRIIREELCHQFVLSSEPRKTYGAKKQSPATRMGSAALIREQLSKARLYDQQRETETGGDLKLRSLSRVFHGMPVKFCAHQENDIRTAMRIGEEFSLSYSVAFAYDAMRMADELIQGRVPVIIGPLYDGDRTIESRGRRFDLAKDLGTSGLDYCLMTGHPLISADLAAVYLAMLHKRGLSRLDALSGLTIRSAQIAGIADRVGSLEVGKDADIVIWNGDPLDYYASVHTMLIDGRRVG